MKTLVHTAVLALAAIAVSTPASAFLHESHHHSRAHHGAGCFVTTSPAHHTRGIRHWRSPCPHQERKHLNPYHPGYHRPHHSQPAQHPAPH